MISRRGLLVGLLAATTATQADAFGLGKLGRSFSRESGLGGSFKFTPTDADAIALFNAMVVKPSLVRQSLIQSTIVGLKADGVWALIDALQVYAGHDQDAVLKDWKVPARTASLVNGPVYTLDRGYTTDGISQYLDTNYNPTTNAVSYAQDSAFAALWTRDSGPWASSLGGWFDGTDGVTILPRNASDQITWRMNQAAGVNTAGVITDAKGLTLLNRSAAAAVQIDKNGANIATNGTASAALNSATFNVGRATAAGFVGAQHSIFACGGSLNGSQRAAIYFWLNRFMSAIGAA